jgi:mono/diheme cytochrome c family protein
MMRARLILAAVATLSVAATAASGSAQAPAAAAPVSFEKDIAPLLESNCAVCHLTGDEVGGMALVADRIVPTAVGVASTEAPGLMRIKPGDPDASYLVAKLEGTQTTHGGTGAQMPFGNAPLSAHDITLIRTWIAQGAKP